MNLSFLNPGRYLRFAMLALLLAAQGVSYAHELGHFDSAESGYCSTCSIGNGLGAGVSVSHEAPSVIQNHAQASVSLISFHPVSRINPHFARGPPRSV
jgi:hypothetical protein